MTETETETVVVLHVVLLYGLARPRLTCHIMIEIGIDCLLLGRRRPCPILAQLFTPPWTKAETILGREGMTGIETETGMEAGIAGMVIGDTIAEAHRPTTATDQTTTEVKNANGLEGTIHTTRKTEEGWMTDVIVDLDTILTAPPLLEPLLLLYLLLLPPSSLRLRSLLLQNLLDHLHLPYPNHRYHHHHFHLPSNLQVTTPSNLPATMLRDHLHQHLHLPHPQTCA
jgi:hypothetical protein